MARRTNNSVDLPSSGYCRPGGLGHGSDPECSCRIQEPSKRVFKGGGPDIAAELLRAETHSEPGLSLLIPDSVNSLEKLSAFIIASGHQRGTPEYFELYAKYKAGLQSECSYL
jgi:hypothetical protein